MRGGAGRGAGARAAAMTGSGSAVFGLFGMRRSAGGRARAAGAVAPGAATVRACVDAEPLTGPHRASR